ncbi:hypothetical protein A2617_01880 [Candidatus Daviesbacteria bacterium RIFOXYD1_FULL_41_10]|uniref:Uncharacterized protein n=2 Tax=Candidatus Daviesiibacteriota TaxID=1752718 RepID=A0A1F5N0Z6_9BACT|nr:MAG: hypothetical protein UU67_C0002G0004 [Candidatus Daviesbacteria bacterium GW2011_GWB1_41_5]OGE71253.1 MAG: hypothetical protein A2617_01880 [Candidatus Daviesbacteria bacterium RIFOXYD1_FULL_41_10]
MPVEKDRGQEIFSYLNSLIVRGALYSGKDRYFGNVHGHPLLICTSPNWSSREANSFDFDTDGRPKSLVIVVGKPRAEARELYGLKTTSGDICVPEKLLEYYQLVRSGVNVIQSRSHLVLQTALGFEAHVGVGESADQPFWLIPNFKIRDPEEQLIVAERLKDRIAEVRTKLPQFSS